MKLSQIIIMILLGFIAFQGNGQCIVYSYDESGNRINRDDFCMSAGKLVEEDNQEDDEKLTVKVSDNFAIQISPNPVRDNLIIFVGASVMNSLEGSIFDGTGRIYWSGILISGANQINSLPEKAGLYILKVKSSTGKYDSIKIMKE